MSLARTTKATACLWLSAVILILACASCSSATASGPGPFVGTWEGHTRGLEITKSGTAVENVGDGCCDPVIDVTYQVSNVHQLGDIWVARAVVTAVKVFPGWSEGGKLDPRVGQTYGLKLTRGVVTSTLTGADYCSPKPELEGICGA